MHRVFLKYRVTSGEHCEPGLAEPIVESAIVAADFFDLLPAPARMTPVSWLKHITVTTSCSGQNPRAAILPSFPLYLAASPTDAQWTKLGRCPGTPSLATSPAFASTKIPFPPTTTH